MRDMGGVALAEQKQNILQSKEYLSAQGELPVPIGKCEDGSLMIQDMRDIAHISITGFTGTGKTSFIQTLLLCLLMKAPAGSVELAIFDSKTIDYVDFRNSSSLLLPVITDASKVPALVAWLNAETQSRYDKLIANSVNDIHKYNEKVPEQKMPHIFVILDDFAAITLDKSLVDSLTSVLIKGRQAGIHFILSTSLSSAKVLQKEILSQIPCKITFCVSSKAESKFAIEIAGAEGLYVPGEMFFKWQNTFKKCQCVHVDSNDIGKALLSLSSGKKKTVADLSRLATNVFSVPSKQTLSKAMPVVDTAYDELLPDAASIIISNQKASIGTLQRTLKLGFNRCARMMDQLQELGVVSSESGTSPRRVLMTQRDWEEVCYKKGWKTSKPVTVTPPTTVKENPVPDTEKEKEVTLRNFSSIQLGDATLSIRDNKIRFEKKVMTRFGMGTATPEFGGEILTGLIYKKPRFFSGGYIQFRFKDGVKVNNQSPELLTVNDDNLQEFMKIDFGSNEARIMWLFIKQISEDTGLPITQL